MNNGNLYTYCSESIIEYIHFHTTNRKRAFSSIEKESELTPGLNLKIQCNQASKATVNKTVIMYMLLTVLSLNPT